MGFYFCGKHIYIDGDEKELERDMYVALPYFLNFNDHDGYEYWKSQLEFFSDISL